MTLSRVGFLTLAPGTLLCRQILYGVTREAQFSPGFQANACLSLTVVLYFLPKINFALFLATSGDRWTIPGNSTSLDFKFPQHNEKFCQRPCETCYLRIFIIRFIHWKVEGNRNWWRKEKDFFYFSFQHLPLESLYPLLLRFRLEVKSWSTKLFVCHNVSCVIISLFFHQFHIEKKERWTPKHFVTLQKMQGTVSHSFSASSKLASLKVQREENNWKAQMKPQNAVKGSSKRQPGS